MVSQSRAMQPGGQTSVAKNRGPDPSTMLSLPRLLAVVALTGLVVLIWGLQDSGAPASALFDESGAVLTDAGRLGPIAEIAAPSSARLPIPAASATTSSVAPQVDLPRLRPNALPRPPELAEPIQPDNFIRFTARNGDTVYDISIVYGVDIDEILEFNPALGDGTQISVGQVIFVPSN